jgi:hypothetical protein
LSEGANVRGWVAIAKDVLNVLHLPGGETLGAAVERAIERRNRATLEILLAELQEGERRGVNFDQDDVHELADMILRLGAAAAKGAARNNLRLMAQVIVGLKRNRTLEFDRFQKWANVLESLTRDEILVLARAYRISRSAPSDETFWKRLTDDLSDQFSNDEIVELMAGLIRTGLIIPRSGWSTLVYDAGPSLSELGELAELELSER